MGCCCSKEKSVESDNLLEKNNKFLDSYSKNEIKNIFSTEYRKTSKFYY